MRAISMLLLGVIFVWVAVTHAQVEISGYYENTLRVETSTNAEDLLLDTSKLRLDFNAGGGEHDLLFSGSINGIARHADVSLDLSAYLPDPVEAELESLGVLLVMPLERDRIYIDNAYVEWNTGRVRIRLGKQQLSWGPGYSFNPTDLFHRKRILDPTYDKEGVSAFRFDYQWGVGGEVTAITVPGSDWENSGFGLRAGTHVNALGYDVALTLHQVRDSVAMDQETFVQIGQQRRAVGFEASGPFLGLGIWIEGNYNVMEQEDDFLRVITGLDHTLEGGMHVMVEGLYNGRGSSDAPYDAAAWLSYLISGEPLAKYQVMAGLSTDLAELMKGSLYAFGCSDGSYLFNPRIDYSIAQNADLTFYGGITIGDDNGQFVPGIYSVLGRITLYF